MGRTITARRRGFGDLLALSAAAVVGIYLAGYLVTEAESNSAQPSASIPEPRRTGAYRDGTYLGEGTGQFGSVFVVVVIAGGRISGVYISATTTTFPRDVIASLPGEVLAHQGPSVDLVSGASGSSAAFIQAVRVALQQARA